MPHRVLAAGVDDDVDFVCLFVCLCREMVRVSAVHVRDTATPKITGNRSDGVPVIIWYEEPLEIPILFCKSKYVCPLLT